MEHELISNGLSAFVEDNLQTALAYFSKALEKNETNEKALLYRACTSIKIGEYDNALKDLDRIKEPTFETLYQKAIAYFNKENFEEAKKHLTSASKADKADQIRLNNLLTKLEK
jgi:Flp pilus assembly protein TadD